MTTHRGPATNCACCKRPGWHAARGLIDACYARHKAAGTLLNFPRRTRPAAETREEYEFLKQQGLSDTEVAARLGITRQALQYALEATAA